MVQHVLHLHPGFISLQGDAPQAGAASVLGGSSPLVVPILELGVLSKGSFLCSQWIEVDAQILSQVYLIPGGAAPVFSLQIKRMDWTFPGD